MVPSLCSRRVSCPTRTGFAARGGVGVVRATPPEAAGKPVQVNPPTIKAPARPGTGCETPSKQSLGGACPGVQCIPAADEPPRFRGGMSTAGALHTRKDAPARRCFNEGSLAGRDAP